MAAPHVSVIPLNCTFKVVKMAHFMFYIFPHQKKPLLEQERLGLCPCSHDFPFLFVFKRTTSIFRDFHTKARVGVGSTPSCPPVSQKPTWKPSKLFKV